MKKGPAILIFIGVAVVIAVFLLPVTPKVDKSELMEQVDTTSVEANHVHSEDVDAEVQAAVESLSDTTKPPMQAILKLRQLAEDHPENVSANFTLGMLSMRTAQYENALMRFDNVLAIAPENTDAYAMKAQAYQALGKNQEAKEILEKALSVADEEKKPSLQQALNELNNN